MRSKVSLRRIEVPGQGEHEVAYRRVAAVTGYHKDKLTNGRWYNNFIIEDVLEANLPEQVVLDITE